jgi:hypothetical protein
MAFSADGQGSRQPPEGETQTHPRQSTPVNADITNFDLSSLVPEFSEGEELNNINHAPREELRQHQDTLTTSAPSGSVFLNTCMTERLRHRYFNKVIMQLYIHNC